MKKVFAIALPFVVFLTSCGGFEYTLDGTPSIETPLIEEKELPDIIENDTDPLIVDNIKDDTKVEIIENDEVFCMELYQPVCGMVEASCDDESCELMPQTFSNSCYAEKAKAKEIKEGICE